MGLFEYKIRQFPETLKWAKKQDVGRLSQYLLSNPTTNRLFLASGGSYSAAAFAELLSAEKGIMARAITPFFYCGSGFSSIPARTLLVSAGGNNKDISRGYHTAHDCPRQEVGAITLRPKGALQDEMRENGELNLFDYVLPTAKDGFLSTTTVLAFYVLLYRAYGYEDLEALDLNLSETESNDIHDFVEHLKRISLEELTQHEAYLHKLEGVDSFFILFSAKSAPPALDIESKFSEGALGNTQLADYRNFAHGRFNWFTQRPGQTGLICLQTPDDVEMSEDILTRLPNHVPILRLRTKHTTPLAAIDLLVKEHYLCSALGERWGLDLSRPVVPDYGRYIHNL
ncbi:MAG: hypothetical protein LIO90_04425 [Bacteroidales bacterium]|nr:hypothetical protein [Bacteroidales bacterium]